MRSAAAAAATAFHRQDGACPIEQSGPYLFVSGSFGVSGGASPLARQWEREGARGERKGGGLHRLWGCGCSVTWARAR